MGRPSKLREIEAGVCSVQWDAWRATRTLPISRMIRTALPPIATTLGEQWIAGDLAAKLEIARARRTGGQGPVRSKPRPSTPRGRKARNPKEVTLKGMDKIDEQLAVVAGEGELPLPRFIEILRASFTGSHTDGYEPGKGASHARPARKQAASGLPADANSSGDQAQEEALRSPACITTAPPHCAMRARNCRKTPSRRQASR